MCKAQRWMLWPKLLCCLSSNNTASSTATLRCTQVILKSFCLAHFSPYIDWLVLEVLSLSRSVIYDFSFFMCSMFGRISASRIRSRYQGHNHTEYFIFFIVLILFYW
ncbi:hypothetical protein BT96DRAFT_513321 [Gymnopus androsaceus JB14]|uniref:Secreted protein n=1 Tax=Gymnopus androsaceus JB14 TaxID=1447944 RepID=A0A6A4GN37_9AGAR|nr:hypothetical protein BT96DRAFT_513321 [Gymnopus androsaceus JB14]